MPYIKELKQKYILKLKQMKSLHLVLGLGLLLAVGCTSKSPKSPLAEENFKFDNNGLEVSLYTIQNANGLVAQFTNYGARLVSMWVPDKNGNWADVVVGFGSGKDFVEQPEQYFGATIGRYGNRIGNATFTIDSVVYQLEKNDGANSLHGGFKGLHKRMWEVPSVTDQSITFTYTSPEGQEGYPGNVNMKVTFTLTDENELEIDYEAETDKKTVLNLTNHAYWNLTGDATKSINGHELEINANHFTPVDEGLIPTGELKDVIGTPFDFTELTTIGDRVDEDDQQLNYGKGYDHNWVLNESEDELTFAAKVVEPVSGRIMEIYTSEPGIQFYGGNFMSGELTGKEGKLMMHRAAFCLETQHFPDSPNKPEFPSTSLNPGEKYTTKSVYKFSGF